jgi:hypothetical protein
MGMIYSNHLWWFGYGLSKFFWVYHITKYINILVRRSLRSSKPHACARLPPRFKLQELKIQLSCKTSSRKGQTSFKIHGSCKAENSSRTRFLPKTQKTLNVTMTKWFVRFNAKKSQSIAPATKNGPKDSSHSKCRAHSDPSHRVLFWRLRNRASMFTPAKTMCACRQLHTYHVFWNVHCPVHLSRKTKVLILQKMEPLWHAHAKPTAHNPQALSKKTPAVRTS